MVEGRLNNRGLAVVMFVGFLLSAALGGSLAALAFWVVNR